MSPSRTIAATMRHGRPLLPTERVHAKRPIIKTFRRTENAQTGITLSGNATYETKRGLFVDFNQRRGLMGNNLAYI